MEGKRQPTLVTRRLVIGAIGASLTAMAGVLGAYIYRFHGRQLGGTTEWGTFGDYVGGCLNAIFGFLTVIMVVLAFREARNEAASERNRLAREEKLSLHIRRLEAAHRIWYRITSRRYSGSVGFANAKIPAPTTVADQLHRNVLQNDDYAKYAKNWAAFVHPHKPSPLCEKFADAAELVDEISGYCRLLDEIDRDHIITAFYRKRFMKPARFLGALGMLQDEYFILNEG